ncbi:MAG TPA: hypothetical protein H9686_04655, partial [Firmicutes bacterium]|nr:hypothetical protein [Bacillota bacterium]
MFCGFNLSYILRLNKQKQTKQNNSFFLTEMRVFLTGKFVFKQTDGQNKAENAGSGGNSSDCQTNGGERALLYQFGVPLACGGLVLYDCCTQESIASPRVRAGVSKKKRHCVYSAVMVVGSTGLVRSGATEYSRGVLRGVQANGEERVLLYQIGIAFARG